MKYLSKIILVLLVAAGISACSDLLNPETPQNKPVSSINDVNDLEGLLNGAYSRLATGSLYGRDYVLAGDVRTSNAWSNGHSGRFNNIAMLNITDNTGLPAPDGSIWSNAYALIANTNLIINSDISGKAAKPVIGQAYALRALSHMMLLKIYGQRFVSGSDLGIPYITHFGNRKYFFPKRLSYKKVWDKIEADYKKALSMLEPSKKQPATKLGYYGVKALLSRFYLYTGDYGAAAKAAKDVIDSGHYSLVAASEYVKAWQKDGQPAVIFEVAMTSSDNRGNVGLHQMLAGDSYADVEVTKTLYDMYGKNDVRKKLYSTESSKYDDGNPWTAYRMTGKYPSKLKNTPVIRYAEVILTYAEAEYRLGDHGVAKTYLNKIAKHRYTDGFTYSSVSLDKILKERRLELAFEGDYYWQLLRNHKGIDRQMVRSGLINTESVHVPYGKYLLAMPIPVDEINANPNMKQNQGY